MATMALASNAIAFTEIEWRSSAVVASANRTIVTIAKGSRVAFAHYRLLCSLKMLSSCERDLLDLFHSQDAIVALEQATPEQLRDIADKILDSQGRADQAIRNLQSLQLGYWARIYAPTLNRLQICHEELRSHAATFLDDNASLVILSKRDQRHLLASLENPPEPNAALRGAFGSRQGAPQRVITLDPPQGYRVERLDTARHSREGFSCGEEALDLFLLQNAGQNQKKFQSSTHVVLEGDGSRIVGYVTLINARMPLTDLPPTSKKLTNQDEIAGTMIARMAVDLRWQGKRIGEFLLRYALKTSLAISHMSSCFVVFLDAKDKAKQFYLKYGFTELPERPSRLYMPIATVAKLFPN